MCLRTMEMRYRRTMATHGFGGNCTICYLIVIVWMLMSYSVRLITTEDLLRQITLLLIDSRAWGKQLQLLQNDYSVRQALVGWLDTAKRLVSTRQANRRQSLLSEGRKLMKKCADAVPVWIMPIAMVAENFDPGQPGLM